ncbi:hypothetical protein A8924_2383 [Saccharopolyspora erythraea NRRL 2338]|uniref:Uncharacterized protein n=2 Tax=Saccharopolyspora erythraea TaxID=1836 RepID=A0ABN1CHL5_SACER|nr:hypothetical protein A8924_2383 [Saccharopolyspora erythraea NRRL 2338]
MPLSASSPIVVAPQQAEDACWEPAELTNPDRRRTTDALNVAETDESHLIRGYD